MLPHSFLWNSPALSADSDIQKVLNLFLCPCQAPLQALDQVIGASLVAQMVKNLPAMRETRIQPWVGKTPGGGHGNPLQYSCLENPVDTGAWWAMVDGVVDGVEKNRPRLSN